MKQTINQFVASVKKIGAPEEMEYQVNAWPYPQANQSHISFWLKTWPHETGMMPNRQVRVSLDFSDCPGVLMRVKEGEFSPSEVVKELKKEE